MVKNIVGNESSFKQLAAVAKTTTKFQQNLQNKNVTDKFWSVLDNT